MFEKYKIWVRCPKCGQKQRSELVKSHKCVYCGHVFRLFPRSKKSRICLVKGNIIAYFNDVEKLKREGKS